MQFLLFNRDEQLIGTLKNVLEAYHTEELNGEDILELVVAGEEVEKNYRIVFKDEFGYYKEFIIKEIQEEHTAEGIIQTLYCESSFYELWGDYIVEKRPYDTTANIALESALLSTRWSVGIVDDLGINSVSLYHISAKEAVQKIAETWKGEIRTRIEVTGNKITARYIDLLQRRGQDRGKRFTYTKDLQNIRRVIHSDEVITALYGYGKGEEVGEGYGRRIDFSEINNGKAYVENLEALAIWGRPNPDGTKSHVFGKIEFDDIEDKHELLARTQEKLAELSQPKISYEAKVINLKAFGFDHEGVELGDIVRIIDKEFKPELRLTARVIKIKRNLLYPEDNEIVLGNFIPNLIDDINKYDMYISNFRSKQGVWDRANIIDDDGISAQYLKNLIDELNARLNSLGGYVYFTEDGKGLITYDRPPDQNPTMAIQILGGAFRIADSKNPDGTWNWRTFGTGKGFYADYFVGGILKGGKVEFNLTNGTLLIGDSVENYQLFYDGQHLDIRLSSGQSLETAISGIEGAIQDLNDAIENIDFSAEIGGRNLVLNSEITNLTSASPITLDLSEDLIAGQKYMLSLWVVGTATAELKDDSTLASLTVTNGMDSIEIEPQVAGTYKIVVSTPSTASLVRVKLERGTIATDWTQAPEDMVTKYNVITVINASPEQIKIQANKIDLSGYVTFTDLSTSGRTSIHGANIITGSISANKLNVASLSAISANLGTVTAGTLYGVNVIGGVIKTSDTANRLEMSYDSFKAYYNSVKRVEYSFDRIKFFDTSGELCGWVYAGQDIFSLEANSNISLDVYSSSVDYALLSITAPHVGYPGGVEITAYNTKSNYGPTGTGKIVLRPDFIRLETTNTAGSIYLEASELWIYANAYMSNRNLTITNGAVSVDTIRGYTNSNVIKLGTTGPSVDMTGGFARWKRSSLDYIFQSDMNFSVYLGGSICFAVTSNGNADVFGNTIRLRNARTPASSTATGNVGDICWDSNYIYVCVATNRWKRVPLSSW